MMKKIIASSIVANFLFTPMFVSAEEHAHNHDNDPLVTKVMFDQLEFHHDDGANPLVVEAQAWVGKDVNKFWLKTDFEKRDGETEEAEVEALYSRAIAPYWDLQIGIRQDIKPAPTQTWGVIGVQGLAPYFFELDTAVFIGESGNTALRFSAEYEILFTQQLILSPEIEMNFHGQNNWEASTGSGLSDITAGLRLRYEMKREFAPYIGVNWNRQFGTTADMTEMKGQPVSDANLVTGVRIWF